MSVPVVRTLKKQTMGEVTKIVVFTCVLCLVFYNIVGLLGYLQFGDLVQPDIMLNYEVDTFVVFGMGILALKYTLSYPLPFFVTR